MLMQIIIAIIIAIAIAIAIAIDHETMIVPDPIYHQQQRSEKYWI
jgi:hypothetical protein